jgi:hypothetical protein
MREQPCAAREITSAIREQDDPAVQLRVSLWMKLDDASVKHAFVQSWLARNCAILTGGGIADENRQAR